MSLSEVMRLSYGIRKVQQNLNSGIVFDWRGYAFTCVWLHVPTCIYDGSAFLLGVSTGNFAGQFLQGVSADSYR
jgi:hypothetical protein